MDCKLNGSRCIFLCVFKVGDSQFKDIIPTFNNLLSFHKHTLSCIFDSQKLLNFFLRIFLEFGGDGQFMRSICNNLPFFIGLILQFVYLIDGCINSFGGLYLLRLYFDQVVLKLNVSTRHFDYCICIIYLLLLRVPLGWTFMVTKLSAVLPALSEAETAKV